MTFLRIKKINNHPYCYLVQNKHTKQGPRQKVKKYLGRAYPLEKKQDLEFPLPEKNNKPQLLKSLIIWELQQHNFKLKKENLTQQKFSFHYKTFQPKKQHKDAVFSLNEGFLCPFTIKRILNFKKSNDLEKDSRLLAKYFIEAGLQPPQDIFIKYYQKC